MAKPMMGLGMPDPIGGAPQGEPDGDEAPMSGGGATLSPETVKYHADPHACGNCHHNQGGECEVIRQQVTDEGACDVWEGEGGGGGEPDGDEMPMPPPGGPMR